MEKSRAELLKTIEGQGEQLSRYENRLRDVVSAYKNLVNEKEALEASVTALSKQPSNSKVSEASRSSNVDVLENPDQAPAPESDEEAPADSSCGDGGHEDADAESHESKDVLATRIATLSSSLATITAQKSRMEASFQADKKQLLQDNESLQRQHQTESEQSKSEITLLKAQVDSLHQRLREQQMQHDQEQTNHAVMLRELQQLVAEERSSKDDLELKLGTIKDSSSLALASERSQNEMLVCKLNAEIKGLKSELDQRGKSTKEDTVVLQQVQVQLAQMKLQHSEVLSKERQRVADCEQRIAVVSRREEERVASLETQLSELTVMVGRYDRLRDQDQQTITQLQEQVAEGNKVTVQLREELSVAQGNDITKEMVTLRDRHSRLRLLLQEASPELLAAAESADSPAAEMDKQVADHLHKACQERYKKIYDEFEAYKASTSLAQRASRQEGNTEEMRRLQGQVRHLRDRLQPMQQQLETFQSSLEERDHQIDHLQGRLEEEKQDHQKALSSALTSHQQQLLSIQSARERSFALLQDREAEIEKLRDQVASTSVDDWSRSSAVFSSSRRGAHGSTSRSPADSLSEATPLSPTGPIGQAVEDLLVHSGQNFSNTSNGSLLHYVQQQQRVATEVEQCRNQRDDLIVELRECRERADRHEEMCGLLKEEIRKLDRNKDRSTASLEYLKNVVLSYMTIDGHSPGRLHIANAIATILKFSPEERQKAIQNVGQASWWPPALKPGSS